MNKAVRVFKIFTEGQWVAFQRDGTFAGSADDLRDGYIHMSAQPQLEGTLQKHFAGQSGLVIAEIAIDRLGSALKWETARDGALFPHLYRSLTLNDLTDSEAIKTQ